MKLIRHQIPVIPGLSPVKMAFKTVIKVYSVAYDSTKIEFWIFRNNRVFFASAFLSVQFKSNTGIFRILQYSVYPAIPPYKVTQIWETTS